MKKQNKVYKVTIGMVQKNDSDMTNWDSRNVVATDVPGVLTKFDLGKNEYISEVELIALLDE